MIQKLHIKNYKILKDNQFDLSNLNIFTGINGMGKSSLIQTLLLLRQSYLKDNILEKQGLLLKSKDYVEIGSGKDALSVEVEKTDNITFELNWKENRKASFCFDYLRKSDKDTEKVSNSEILRKNSSTNYSKDIFSESLFLYNDMFHYLNAEREGPKAFNDISTEYVDLKKDMGKYGQYALYYYQQYKNEPINNLTLKHEKAKTNSLADNVSAWLSEISPNTKIDTHYMSDIQQVRGAFSISKGIEFRPTNVGFGLTYVLPVILALLNTKENGLVIIENPESHLHPSGQSKMSELIAKCAASGRQVLIETHSDHIINGILVEIYKYFKEQKKEQEKRSQLNGISREQVKMYYFEKEEESNTISKNININISETGRIKHPPKGFFDQFQKDLRRLLQ